MLNKFPMVLNLSLPLLRYKMKTDLLKELKVLIVEDEAKLSKLLRDAIKEYFYNVIVARNGQEGIAKYKSAKPDIIITDIMMPIMDGLEMSIEIKKLNENMPIIVLSAFSDKDKLLKAIDVGITKYFIKPFDPDEVVEFLNELAQKLRKQKVIKLNENFSFDNNSMSLYHKDKLVNLTKREREFVFLLIENNNKVLDTDDIKEALWKDSVSDERLRTFIKRLRVKTSKDFIQNASGQGYLISINNV